MPETTHQAAATLRFPGTYIHLYSTYLYLRFLDNDLRFLENANGDEVKRFPLQISISYGDISGQRHHVSFSLRVNFFGMHTTKDSPVMFEAYIDAEKLSGALE
jgi:hypothetical protein